MKHDSLNIGEKIKELRISKGFTQQQLELEIEASFGHICRIEKGDVNPTKETLLKIADVLQLSIQEKLELFPTANAKSLPKIGLIFEGGGFFTVDPQKLSDNEKVLEVNKWMLQVPEIQTIAKLEPISPFTFLPSCMIGTDQYESLAKQIYDNYEKYDGFIVMHGLDTMPQTASAISFMLQNLNKPIIFTGHYQPVFGNKDISFLLSKCTKEKVSNQMAKINMINAVYAASADISEVAILYNRKVHRANRTIAIHYYDDSIYESKNIPLLAISEFGLEIAPHCIRRNNNKLKYYPKLEKKVAYLKLHPNIDPAIIEYYISQKYRGIVLEVIGSGSFPPSIIPNIEKATKQGISVLGVASNQADWVNLEMFYISLLARDVGVIPTKDMTAEAAYMKLMWVLAQTDDPQKIKEMMLTNYVGEITE